MAVVYFDPNAGPNIQQWAVSLARPSLQEKHKKIFFQPKRILCSIDVDIIVLGKSINLLRIIFHLNLQKTITEE